MLIQSLALMQNVFLDIVLKLLKQIYTALSLLQVTYFNILESESYTDFGLSVPHV